MRCDQPWRLAVYGTLAALFWLLTGSGAIGAWHGYEGSFVLTSVYLMLAATTTGLAFSTFPQIRTSMDVI